jgi:GT2 family glycosyltransferase
MLNRLSSHEDNNHFKKSPVVLIAKVKNESKRILFFLNYYRMIGIESFIFIDNNSTDGTCELLASQNDVLTLSTKEPLYHHNTWIKEVLQAYRVNSWSLVVDLDELFCFPYLENTKITQLLAYLDYNHFTAVESLLIDMYPKGYLSHANMPTHCSPLSELKYFDSNSHFLKRTRYYGGVRKRIFNIEPCLTKFPLFKYNKNMAIEAGMHSIRGVKSPRFSTALLHCKFDANFSIKAQEAIETEVYWNDSEEYKKYALKEDWVLYDDNFSAIYSDSQSLIKKDIMRADLSLTNYIRKIKNPTVSIIICSSGTTTVSPALLQSLEKQTYQDFELIIIDNNPNPTIHSTDTIIDQIVHERESGLSFARNKGVQTSIGSYLLFIDDDVILDKACIENLVQGVERFQSDIVGGDVLLRQDITVNLTRKERRFLSELTYTEDIEKVEFPKYIIGACMLIKRSTFIKYGLFFTGLGREGKTLLSGEETEFIKRINKYGGKVSYIKDATCTHNINLERVKFKYLLRRAYWQGITDCKINKIFNEEFKRNKIISLNIRDTFLNLFRRIGYQVEVYNTRHSTSSSP